MFSDLLYLPDATECITTNFEDIDGLYIGAQNAFRIGSIPWII